jgi:hypothetical protein
MRRRRTIVGAAAVLTVVISAPWLQLTEAHNPITTTVRFDREVAQILNAKCAACHKPDGMSMSLQTYDEVRPWAVAIKEEVLSRRMPPWPAERGYGTFANDAGLTLREQEFLVSWIEGGVPRGDGAPPPSMDHSGHWMLGTPTGIYTGTAAVASPRPGFRRYVMETRGAAATFVRAFDFKPGDPHARAAFFTLEGTGQFLGGWTPSNSSTRFPRAVFRASATKRACVRRPAVDKYRDAGTCSATRALRFRRSWARGQRSRADLYVHDDEWGVERPTSTDALNDLVGASCRHDCRRRID